MTQLMTPEQIGERVAPIKMNGINLLEQAKRAEITNAEILASAGDLYKVINTQLKSADEARKSLVKPLNDHVKWINAQFKETNKPMEEAKGILKKKMDDYIEEETRRQEEEARKAREKAEVEAVARAQEAEIEGKSEEAEAIIDAAADLPDALPAKKIARGSLGASTSSRTDWLGEVVDMKAFLQAIIDGHLTEDFIEVNQARLNKLAKTKKIEKTNYGIRLYKKISATVR